MAALRSHIDALNSHCASSAFSQIKLDEDTVSIQVKAEGCKGTVNISLHERSSYPRTGGLAFADGSDQLVAAVESVSEAIGEKAALDHVLRLLSSKLTDKATEALVASLPAPTGSAPVPAAHDDDDDDDDNDDDGLYAAIVAAARLQSYPQATYVPSQGPRLSLDWKFRFQAAAAEKKAEGERRLDQGEEGWLLV